jgi:triosephosphate isomerase
MVKRQPEYECSKEAAVRPLIAGNWKMHGLAPQLEQIKAAAASVKAVLPGADVLICVPPILKVAA